MPRYDVNTVRAAIQDKGFWEDFVEWRIFTTTHFRITPIEQLDERNQTKRLVYAVRVHCDYDLRCECPTLERALQFCDVFQDWIMRAFTDEGWPSWAHRTRVEP